MMVRVAVAAALIVCLGAPAGAQTCLSGYKSAAGACVKSCPGGYEVMVEPASIVGRAEAEALKLHAACWSGP